LWHLVAYSFIEERKTMNTFYRNAHKATPLHDIIQTGIFDNYEEIIDELVEELTNDERIRHAMLVVNNFCPLFIDASLEYDWIDTQEAVKKYSPTIQQGLLDELPYYVRRWHPNFSGQSDELKGNLLMQYIPDEVWEHHTIRIPMSADDFCGIVNKKVQEKFYEHVKDALKGRDSTPPS